ncbi:class II fructose-bisphosphate aldolase [Mangrovibacter phragmitis]|uniref:class II fructose-bisphosphate aldolase n=1 Tax=Mangrovibacter phragmitis TaxID=1691903 RepID=UPI00336AD56F
MISAEFARLVIKMTEKLHSPVILEAHPYEYEFTGDDIIYYLREFAIKTTVPVVIHLGFGQILEQVMRTIRTGYTSVMIGASALPFEENLERHSKRYIKEVK